MMGTRTVKLAITLAVILSYVFPAVALNDDLCAQYGDFTPIPHLDGQDFCQTAGLTDASVEKCLLIDLAGKAFTRRLGDTIAELECRAAQQLPSASHATDGKQARRIYVVISAIDFQKYMLSVAYCICTWHYCQG